MQSDWLQLFFLWSYTKYIIHSNYCCLPFLMVKNKVGGIIVVTK